MSGLSPQIISVLSECWYKEPVSGYFCIPFLSPLSGRAPLTLRLLVERGLVPIVLLFTLGTFVHFSRHFRVDTRCRARDLLLASSG